MKITIVMGFFLPVPPLQGGATEKIWFRFAQEFASAGNDVTMISRRWPGLPNREDAGPVKHVRIPGWNHTKHLPLNLVLDLRWSLRALRAAPAGDILVSNNVSLPIFARRMRPSVGRVAVVLGRMPKGQTRVYGAVDRVLATSTAVFDQVRRENPSLVSRSLVMLNPVDCRALGDDAISHANEAPVTIGYVGRVNPEKNLETLIDAAGRLQQDDALPPWRIVIIGPYDVLAGGGGPDYFASLASRAEAALPRRNFEFAGPIFDPAALASRYREIDVFCYPTRAERGEGLSVAPIEAMAAGAVPVVSDLACFTDLIRPGINGFRFDHRAPDAAAELARTLSRLIADSAHRQTIARQAREDAQRFDYSVIAQRLLADFEQLRG